MKDEILHRGRKLHVLCGGVKQAGRSGTLDAQVGESVSVQAHRHLAAGVKKFGTI